MFVMQEEHICLFPPSPMLHYFYHLWWNCACKLALPFKAILKIANAGVSAVLIIPQTSLQTPEKDKQI
jgi:hypothetical protein